MAQPTQPWNNYTYPLKGARVPGMVIHAGMFTTDSSGNVTSVSGLAPGMTVSGTSLSSGVYTCFFGDGPNINQVGTGRIGAPDTFFAGGAPSVADSFNRILFLTAESVRDTSQPTSDLFQTIEKNSVTGQAKIQFLASTVTTPIASGQFVSTAYKPALCASRTVEVLAFLWIHKDAV